MKIPKQIQLTTLPTFAHSSHASHGYLVIDKFTCAEPRSELTDSLLPTLKTFDRLHTFDIETHTQYYAPLTEEVQQRHDHSKGTDEKTILSSEDLKAFVNSAQWSLGQFHRRPWNRTELIPYL